MELYQYITQLLYIFITNNDLQLRFVTPSSQQ